MNWIKENNLPFSLLTLHFRHSLSSLSLTLSRILFSCSYSVLHCSSHKYHLNSIVLFYSPHIVSILTWYQSSKLLRSLSFSNSANQTLFQLYSVSALFSFLCSHLFVFLLNFMKLSLFFINSFSLSSVGFIIFEISTQSFKFLDFF